MSVSPLELLNSEDMIARMKEEFLDEGSRQAVRKNQPRDFTNALMSLVVKNGGCSIWLIVS